MFFLECDFDIPLTEQCGLCPLPLILGGPSIDQMGTWRENKRLLAPSCVCFLIGEELSTIGAYLLLVSVNDCCVKNSPSVDLQYFVLMELWRHWGLAEAHCALLGWFSLTARVCRPSLEPVGYPKDVLMAKAQEIKTIIQMHFSPPLVLHLLVSHWRKQTRGWIQSQELGRVGTFLTIVTPFKHC